MRLIDLARPYLDGVHTIVEVTAAGLDLKPYLSEVAGVTYLRWAGPPGDEPGGRAGDEAIDTERLPRGAPAGKPPAAGKGVMLVVATGPNPHLHLPPRVCREVLAQVEDGARGLVLFGHGAADLPYQEIAGTLVSRGCQVLQAATLDYADLPSGIAFAAGEDLPPGAALRVVNESVLAGFVARGVRARYEATETCRTSRVGRTSRTAPTAAENPAELEVARVENERLAQALKEAGQRLVDTQQRVAALERSVAMEIGRTFVAAARHPWPDAARLPRDLYRLSRGRRGKWGRRADTAAARQEGEGVGVALTGRLLSGWTSPATGWELSAPDRLVVAGVLSPRTCATLAPDASVQPLPPHAAVPVLEGSGADIVIIDAAAALAGGPWSYLGDPAAADRDRRLDHLITAARAWGIPVVFFRSLPRHRAPGLEVFADRCDVVLEGDLGVQLARFNPVDLDPARPCEAVFAGRRDPREPPGQRQLLDEVIPGVRVADGPELGWRAEPGLYRRHGLFVTASPQQAREQVACGARVVGPLGSAEPVAGAAYVTDAAAAAAEMAAARRLGVRTPGEVRELLREIFTTHATAARLAEITRMTGAAADPLAARRAAVLAVLAPGPAADTAGPLASALARQRHRPAEVVLVSQAASGPDDPGNDAALDAMHELKDMGISVHAAREPGLAGAARAARSPWVVPWEAGKDYPDTYLLDLMCARECSRADAVGEVDGADYVFTPRVQPALARRELCAGPEGRLDLPAGAAPRDSSGELSPQAWARRGHTLFSIGGR
jgi:hypothetical protein